MRRKQLTRNPSAARDTPPATLDELVQALKSGCVGLDNCPVPQLAIADAETEVGLGFPPSYRWFLENHGLGSYRDYTILGLGCPFEDEPCPDHCDVLAHHRDNLESGWNPQHLMVLSAAEGDEVFYLALNESDTAGECPVYLLSEQEVYAPSFGDFLFRLSRQG